MSMSQYTSALNPKGYVNNTEITNLDGQYLVKGSRNCLISNKDRVDSRRGMTLIGGEKTKNKGTKSSYDWYTSTGLWRNIKINDKIMYVWYKDAFIPFKTGLSSDKLNFVPWWDTAESIDRLLFVDGSDAIYSWSGAITEVASVTTNTITKSKYLSGTTYAFVDGGASDDTITDSANGFSSALFVAGDTIRVLGSASNDGEYTIKSVTAGTLTLSEEDSLTSELAGSAITIREAPQGTFAEARFMITGTRTVFIDGTEYAYTGGEGTGTLTGVTPDPLAGGVVAGDTAIQGVKTDNPTDLDTFQCNLISVTNNYVFVGSLTSRTVYMSKSTDFTNFSYTSPLRLVTEGFEFQFDSSPTAFEPNENGMWISGGYSDWYAITFELTADHAGETVRINKFKTATGQSAVNQGCIVNGKNGAMFISNEKTFDFLGKVKNQQSYQAEAISDPIKDDMKNYDFTNAQGVYFERQAFILLPEEGIILIYDDEQGNKYWQPPQYMDLRRLSLIDVDGDGKLYLCGHSNSSDETYKLFDGYSDNLLPYTVIMAFGYDNFGARFDLKQFDELATELYISPNTIVTRQVNLDYLGSSGIQEHTIDGSDTAITFGVAEDVHLGSDYLGYNPFGSSLEELSGYKKARIIHTTVATDFFERQNIFYSQSDGVRFSVLAYAENVEMSDNEPNFIRK